MERQGLPRALWRQSQHPSGSIRHQKKFPAFRAKAGVGAGWSGQRVDVLGFLGPSYRARRSERASNHGPQRKTAGQTSPKYRKKKKKGATCVYTLGCPRYLVYVGPPRRRATSRRHAPKAHVRSFFRIASQNRNTPPQPAPTDLATHTTSRDHDTASGSGESEGARGETAGRAGEEGGVDQRVRERERDDVLTRACSSCFCTPCGAKAQDEEHQFASNQDSCI